MSAVKFVTMRLGKDSVDDIRKIDSRPGGIQNPAYVLSVTCKQAPRSLAPGTFAVLWLGSDNSKGAATDWKQGIRAIAKINKVDLGAKHNDPSTTEISIGYIFKSSIDKFDLMEGFSAAYIRFSELPLVGLADYSNQTIREVDYGVRSDIGALLAACGKASSSSLEDILFVYPELADIIPEIKEDGGARGNCTGRICGEAKKLGLDHNLIVHGAPGTGKSHYLDALMMRSFAKENVERVTFYPSYSYSQFVGGYKPVPNDCGGVTYSYVPGPFMRVLVKALLDKDSDHLLLVEEINRANPAAVFGDVFQLLDRKDGESEYPISVSEEASRYLETVGLSADTLSIPANMYIWATMNSADQGVFPIDTAFRRRWHYRYLGINSGEDAADFLIELKCGHKVSWNAFRHSINDKLLNLGINEDKMIGSFFLGSPAEIDAASSSGRIDLLIKEKLLSYLFDDVVRHRRSEFFSGLQGALSYSQVCLEFDLEGEAIFTDTDLSIRS